jgi:hypothetical protein
VEPFLLIRTYKYRASKLHKESRIFPEDIRSNPWVLFHGTSACSEEQVDSSGLDTAHLPVSLQELRGVVGVFKSMNWRESNALRQLCSWSFPRGVDGPESRHVYLSSGPELAACYCGRSSAGGEAAEMVRGCFRELRKFLRSEEIKCASLRDQLVEYEEALTRGTKARVVDVSKSWLQSELSRLAPLETRLFDLCRGRHCGVIYALRFEMDDVPRLYGSDDTYICNGPVPADRIIAKARIIGARCDHLERWPERYYRDSQDSSTLIGIIADRRQFHLVRPPRIDEWELAPIDTASGVDLAETFDRKALLQHLWRQHPGVFEDAERCHEYGWLKL